MAIVRHGQSQGNVKNVWQGARSDVPLTELGKKQAQATAEYVAATMKDVKKVFCSPLKRAHQTASIIATELGVEVEIMLGLIEIDWGDLEGLTTEQIAEQYPDVIRLWGTHLSSPIPGGDTATDVATRVYATLHAIATMHADGGQVVVVSHQGAITLGLGALFNDGGGMLDYQASNCGLMQVEFSPDPELKVKNFTKHLEDAGLETGVWGM